MRRRPDSAADDRTDAGLDDARSTIKRVPTTLAIVIIFCACSAPGLADTSLSAVSPKAVRATGADNAIHLDLTVGLESEHNNSGQVAAVYHYGAAFFKNFTARLKVFGYGGSQIEDSKNSQGPSIRQPVFGAFVYNSGLTYKINPTVSLTASYSQGLGHTYRSSGESITHAIDVQTTIHAF